jgi:hypothetical protein
MKVSKWNALAVFATAALASAVPSAVPARDGGRDEVRLEAALTPTAVDPGAFGEARFESRSDRSELRVEVDDISVTDEVDVFVNGSFIGTIVLDDDGGGRLDLNSQNGDAVPALRDGDEIEVVDANDGVTLILSGILRPRR